jgi:hypothetical protein
MDDYLQKSLEGIPENMKDREVVEHLFDVNPSCMIQEQADTFHSVTAQLLSEQTSAVRVTNSNIFFVHLNK